MASPVDPRHRCAHCFQEIEEDGPCQRCRRAPLLPFPSAFVFDWIEPALCLKKAMRDHLEVLAAFIFWQWSRLDWKIPDAIAFSQDVRKVASILGSWIGCPALPFLKKRGGNWRCDPSLVEEEATLLLLMDESSREEARGAMDALSEAFPKNIYLLTIGSGQSVDCPENGEESFRFFRKKVP